MIYFQGPINNMNLDYLRENYFSKTKSQDVSVEVLFSEGISCVKDLNVDKLFVFGKIQEQER